VLAADTRSTSGSTVADKNCEKIHYIAPNIYCCGAGTAADTENVTGGVGVMVYCVKERQDLCQRRTGPALRLRSNDCMCCWSVHMVSLEELQPVSCTQVSSKTSGNQAAALLQICGCSGSSWRPLAFV
jgi:hypothetical protein